MKKLSCLYVLSAGILWGSMGIFVRNLNKAGLETMDIVFLRALVTACLLGGFLVATRRDKLKIKLKDLWCFLGTGLLSIVFFNYCYFRTIQDTSMSVAAVLLYTSPVFVMLISRFAFKEHISRLSILVLLLTFLGCLFVTGFVKEILGGGQMELKPLGIIIGLGSGLGYALYSIFSRAALERGYDSVTITFYTFFIGIFGSLFGRDVVSVSKVAFAGWEMFILVLMLGLVNTILPYFLYTKGLTKMKNSTAAILATIEPVAATVFGMVVYKEIIGANEVLGMILVLTGIVVLSAGDKIENKNV